VESKAACGQTTKAHVARKKKYKKETKTNTLNSLSLCHIISYRNKKAQLTPGKRATAVCV